MFSNPVLVKRTLVGTSQPHGDITENPCQFDCRVYITMTCLHGDKTATSQDSEIQIKGALGKKKVGGINRGHVRLLPPHLNFPGFRNRSTSCCLPYLFIGHLIIPTLHGTVGLVPDSVEQPPTRHKQDGNAHAEPGLAECLTITRAVLERSMSTGTSSFKLQGTLTYSSTAVDQNLPT